MHLDPETGLKFDALCEVVTAFRATHRYLGADNCLTLFLSSAVRISIGLEYVPSTLGLDTEEESLVIQALHCTAYRRHEDIDPWLQSQARHMLRGIRTPLELESQLVQ
jgi:hypothetical protein